MNRKYRLGFKPSLLPTESEDEFFKFYSALEEAVKLCGVLDELNFNTSVMAAWESMRLQRCRSAMVSAAYFKGLAKVLLDLECQKPHDVAKGWFESEQKRQEIKQLLAKFDLNDTAIEAAAIARCSKEYDLLHRMQSSLENQTTRSLRNIPEFRELFKSSDSRDDRAHDGTVPDAVLPDDETEPEAA